MATMLDRFVESGKLHGFRVVAAEERRIRCADAARRVARDSGRYRSPSIGNARVKPALKRRQPLVSGASS